MLLRRELQGKDDWDLAVLVFFGYIRPIEQRACFGCPGTKLYAECRLQG